MTSIFSDGALHPGRDPNEASWLVLRRPEDFAGALRTNVVIDPNTPALTLQPLPFAGSPDVHQLQAADGTRYLTDPGRHLVLRMKPCASPPAASGWTRLLGARGTEAGKLQRPLGLAIDNSRGLLAVADADNHRVQVVRADSGEPVVLLGATDGWGRGVGPSGSSSPLALAEPVGVAFSGHKLAIADRAFGKVHLYDSSFRWLAAFAPVPHEAPLGFTPAPVAVAWVGCLVWVLDANWSVPVAYDLEGRSLTQAGPAPASFDDWLELARFATPGELVLGPIDGRTEDLAWHRVIVDVSAPEGCAVEVQTFASDDSIAPAAIPWAPASPHALPIVGVEAREGELSRPVLSDQGRWLRARANPYLRLSQPLARLGGSGPVNVADFSVDWTVARRLRVLDQIELRELGAMTPPLAIVLVSDRSIRATVRGDLQNYTAGSRLTLVERDGSTPGGGPRLLATLAAADSLDLSGALADATLYDLPATHAVAALLRDGDVVQLEDGGTASATAVVQLVDPSPATLSLASAVVGDFSNAALRIVSTNERLLVDRLDWTEDPPAGESVFVHDDDAGTTVEASIRWAERDSGTLWLEPGPPVPWATWTNFTLPEPSATDRGRYLWLRLRLLGRVASAGDASALASPIVRSIRLLLPRLSYLRYLPAVYSRRDADDPSGALFLERLLALPEARLTAVEQRYEEVARNLNPLAAPADWLRFIAAWYGLAFDPSWPTERRRELVVNAAALFAGRGTVAGLRRYLEIYLGHAPAIVEGFQWGIVPSITLGSDTTLGTATLGARAEGSSHDLPHHFSIWVFADAGVCGSELTAKVARAIIDSLKPAHTTYELHVVDSNPRVGLASVGIDTVLLGGTPTPPLGATGTSQTVLGQLNLPPEHHRAQSLAPIPLDHDFTLT